MVHSTVEFSVQWFSRECRYQVPEMSKIKDLTPMGLLSKIGL